MYSNVYSEGKIVGNRNFTHLYRYNSGNKEKYYFLNYIGTAWTKNELLRD